jgi:DNA-binding MarR family transcriptional regulator
VDKSITATAPGTPCAGLSPVELDAWRGFLRAHAAVARRLDAELQEHHGLPLTSYDVLVNLEDAEGGRLRMYELAGAVLLSLSGVTRLVDRLVADGLVCRERCAQDRRGAFCVLTDAGRARLAKARPTHLDGVRRLFLAAFSTEELAGLGTLWRRLAP